MVLAHSHSHIFRILLRCDSK
uniref:Uncharacterized protein n=1 Tax=Anguilla anguilla TaxID=7936 RepID=A0A0E9PEC3_ANGAN